MPAIPEIYYLRITMHMRFIVLALVMITSQAGAQTCVTGKLDDRATAFLKHAGTEMTFAQLRSASLETLRKTNGTNKAIPADSIKRVTITPDKIKLNVLNSGGTDKPVIINFHGGGFITPLLPAIEREAMVLAKKFNAVVFDVDYRVAPEFKFPTAPNDAYQAYLWVKEHAKEYGGVADKIFFIGKDAGATLAALVFNKAKQESKQDAIKGIVMICPYTDNPMSSYYDSMEDNATGYGLTKDKTQFYFQTFLEKQLWYTNVAEVWPIHAKDFNGWPATLIVTAEFDVLRDEGIAFGKKLEQAGNTVAIKCYPHQLHNFSGLSASSEEITRVHELIGQLLAGQPLR